MPTITRKFLATPEQVAAVRQALQELVDDSGYNTEPSYIASADIYTDHLIPFAEKHLAYLMSHPKVNPEQHISNLRMMTKIRT
ncbi:MAG: hypothetical protein WCF91_01010 [bacterium]